jgi:hypothetical protein
LATDYVLKFDAAHRVLLIRPGRILTEESFLECYAAVQRFAASVGGCNGITDLTAVEEFQLSIRFLRTVAASPPAFPAGTIRVVVAPDRAALGLSRMFQRFRDAMDAEFQVVRTLTEAFAALSIEEARFDPVPVDTLTVAGDQG